MTSEGDARDQPRVIEGVPVSATEPSPARRHIGPEPRVALVDLLDRLLAGGVVISGDLTLSIADVDMVAISLRVLITSVSGQDVFQPLRHD
ncbi:MAG TPA: gas vesicle protein [Streptosporangiaceae bacterium]|nr:gas vesicle protein [Streptosporangiaceae bacterium]